MKKMRDRFFIKIRYLCIILVISFGMIAFIVSCGGGGGDGGSGINTTPLTPTFDATGTWSITDTTTSDNLGTYLGEISYPTYTITQTGTDFSMDTDDVGSMDDGTVSGSKYTFSKIYDYQVPQTGEWGTVTIEGTFTLTSESNLKGSYSLEWVGSYTHTMGHSIVGIKTCADIAGYWEGTYSENYCEGGIYDGNHSVTFRNDCSVTVGIESMGDFEGTATLYNQTVIITLPGLPACGIYTLTGTVNGNQITGTISSTGGSSGTFNFNKVN